VNNDKLSSLTFADRKMSHDHSKKIINRVWQASFEVPPKIGGTKTKNGAHHYNQHMKN